MVAEKSRAPTVDRLRKARRYQTKTRICGGAKMMTQRINRILCRLAGLFLIAISTVMGLAQAGSQGNVAITVVDTTGGSVPGTALSLIDLATNDTRRATTHENGTYTFTNLNIGNYKLMAEHAGYSTAQVGGVAVHAASTTD